MTPNEQKLTDLLKVATTELAGALKLLAEAERKIAVLKAPCDSKHIDSPQNEPAVLVRVNHPKWDEAHSTACWIFYCPDCIALDRSRGFTVEIVEDK